MASKNLFRSAPRGQTPPKTDTVNSHGKPAYKRTSKEALAQFAATGCFGDTFYTNAQLQLKQVLALCNEVEPEFIAKCAIYSRKFGFMKDAPAFLCAYLANKDLEALKKVFFTAIDNAKMLRNFVQIIRSGVTGRKSLGSAPKKLILAWINSQRYEQLFRGSVGNDPSLADVIKMVHPTPRDKEQAALFGYLIGREPVFGDLPKCVQEFEVWKDDPIKNPIPNVPWEMLTAKELDKEGWKHICRNAGWQMTRMNLNTFERHDVFKDRNMVELVAKRLADPEAIAKARVFPYQLLMAYMNYTGHVAIKEALQDAMELAVQNVPTIEGDVAIAVDVSGSMNNPVTGLRGTATSAARCVDVASLFAACVLRKNPRAAVLPFNGAVLGISLNPRDSIVTNAQKLAALCYNGTNCSAPLEFLNGHKTKVDAVIYFSDNESWRDHSSFLPSTTTGMQQQWQILKARCPKAKLVCLDLVAIGTTQAKTQKDTLNIGGFNDNVFGLIADFVSGNSGKDYWVNKIEEIDVNFLDRDRN